MYQIFFIKQNLIIIYYIYINVNQIIIEVENFMEKKNSHLLTGELKVDLVLR